MKIKFALKDLIRHWRFSLFFVINLSIGLTGFISLEIFKSSLQNHLKANAKQILAADLAIESRRELNQDEENKLNNIAVLNTSIISKSVLYDFFAMATASDKSRLVSVKAVESNFPLYGGLNLRSNIKKTLTGELQSPPKAWVYKEVLDQFGIKVGDQIKLGKVNFIVDDIIEKDSTQTFRSASMAPRIYISKEYLKQTGLIQFGSTFSRAWLFKLKDGVDVSQIKESIYKVISDPSVQVETPDTTSEDSGRQLKYLSDYLGLVTLVALFLSALGAAYLYQLYIQDKLKDIAILRVLGFKASDSISIYFIETLFLGAASLVFSFIFTSLLIPFLGQFINKFIPFALDLKMTGAVAITGIIISIFGSICLSLPYLLGVRDISISQLFSEDQFQSQLNVSKWYSFFPSIILFIFLSIYQAHSFKLGFSFSFGLALVLIIFALIAWVFLSLVARIRIKHWSAKYSLLSLSRKKMGSLALFVSLALGTLLINILPQLKVTLQSTISPQSDASVPSLFIFDIQDEQMESLKKYFNDHNQPKANFSPLIRSRISKVNDQEFERNLNDNETHFQTREEERDARFRNRGINLTYRKSLSDTEEITEGKPFSGQVIPDMAELSVEYKYAERLGLKIGDILTFDIQGVEIKGRIVNLRSVRWTSFQPNFFIVIQPGFLEEAPKTYIGALPRMSSTEKLSMQKNISEKFSNISVIDVDRLVEDILNIAEQMSFSLEIMAWLSVIAGLLVLFSIVRSQVQSRRWEMNMLKILGAKQNELRVYILTEVLLVAIIAAITGALLSLIASATLSRFIFESSLKVNMIWIFSSIMILVLLSFIVASLAAQRVMNESPLQLLNE